MNRKGFENLVGKYMLEGSEKKRRKGNLVKINADAHSKIEEKDFRCLENNKLYLYEILSHPKRWILMYSTVNKHYIYRDRTSNSKPTRGWHSDDKIITFEGYIEGSRMPDYEFVERAFSLSKMNSGKGWMCNRNIPIYIINPKQSPFINWIQRNPMDVKE
jgi:hypothetical protein